MNAQCEAAPSQAPENSADFNDNSSQVRKHFKSGWHLAIPGR